MAHLIPIPFADLVRRMRREAETCRAIFDLPAKKWHHPDPAVDFSATHFGRRVGAPVGPAAGPHTQLAQNIVLSWLGGSRILELKTVQINDRLDIPRPCIHAPNIGFNVEWSQELLVEESTLEYAKAVYLIEILKSTRAFGLLPEEAPASAWETVYDISVGYDLEGIRSPKVTGFLNAMRDAAPLYERLRSELDGDLAEYRSLEPPSVISDCATLSTFHGCPADQIEAICRYLIEELGIHTLIKLNPTLLGYERVREILHDRLGYTHLELRPEAFEHDLDYDQGLAILRRLRASAEERGSIIGAKFTNTLVVANDRGVFPTQGDPDMYLSGPPLHVLSMTLMQQFREDVGFEMPVSFSAGIDARNFPDAVACGMVPVTTCTDLLRQGGYGRLPMYLKNLGKAMRELGVSTREAYVLAWGGHGAQAVETALAEVEGGAALWQAQGASLGEASPDALPARLREAASAAGIDGDDLVLRATRVAGRLNGRSIVPPLVDDPRYTCEKNSKPPRRIDSELALYDCINCDLCISACPNDAIFAYDAEPVEGETQILRFTDDGRLDPAAGEGYRVGEKHQLAVFEGACNECSNCEVYCPEEGAPFAVKEQLFGSLEIYRGSPRDGFCRENGTLHARLGGVEMRFEPSREENRATVTSEGFRYELKWDPFVVERGHLLDPASASGVDSALLWRMRTVWEAIYHGAAPNPVKH